MSCRNRPLRDSAAAAVAAWLVAATASAASDENPVAELRARQDRLQSLDFAVREAELLAQLCQLRPASAECGDLSPAPAPAAQEGLAAPAAAPAGHRVLEIYGSNGRLQAVLLDGRGIRQVVRSGARLDAETVVERIGRDSVTLKRGGRAVTLRVGN